MANCNAVTLLHTCVTLQESLKHCRDPRPKAIASNPTSSEWSDAEARLFRLSQLQPICKPVMIWLIETAPPPREPLPGAPTREIRSVFPTSVYLAVILLQPFDRAYDSQRARTCYGRAQLYESHYLHRQYARKE
jgi:hypothetical protein